MRVLTMVRAISAMLMVALATPVLAQTPTAFTLDIVYEVRVAGLRAFNASSKVRVDGNLYAIEASFHKEGIVAALSQTFSGSNRVVGLLTPSGVTPRAGFSLIEARTKRTWQVVYNPDGTFSEAHVPIMEARPERAVSREQKQGAVDPLSAAVVGMMGASEPCPRTYRIFDSRRRFDVEMRKVGTVRPSPADAPSVEAEGIICQGSVRKIAGYNPEDHDDESQNKNPPKIYLAHIAGARGWYPYRMEMKASFGDVVGRLASVTVRPLTDADRAAMKP